MAPVFAGAIFISASSVHQEVENIHTGVGIGLEQLRVAAARAGNGDESLVLHVKDLCKVAAGCLELVSGEAEVAALRAHVLHLARLSVWLCHLYSFSQQ